MGESKLQDVTGGEAELEVLIARAQRRLFAADLVRAAGWAALVPLGRALLGPVGARAEFLAGGFAFVVAASLATAVLRAAGRGAREVDRRLAAGEALETLLAAREAGGPAARAGGSAQGALLRRALAARLVRARLAAGRGLARAWFRLLALGLLALLALLLAPQAGGKGAAPAGGGGRGGGAARAQGARRAGTVAPAPHARAGEAERQPQPPDQARKPPARPPVEFPATPEDLTVFPPFRAGPKESRREAPRIRRAPPAGSGGAARRGVAAAPRPAEAPAEFRRRAERALGRGLLADYEGRWLKRWAELLEARGR